jgi:hypothetical protein
MEQFGYFLLEQHFSHLALAKSAQEWPKEVPGVDNDVVDMFVQLVEGKTPATKKLPKRKMFKYMVQIADYLIAPPVWTEHDRVDGVVRGIINVGVFLYLYGCGFLMTSDKFFWCLLMENPPKNVNGSEVDCYMELWNEECYWQTTGQTRVTETVRDIKMYPWVMTLLQNVPNLVIAGGAVMRSIMLNRLPMEDIDLYIIDASEGVIRDVFKSINKAVAIEGVSITAWSIKIACRFKHQSSDVTATLDLVRRTYKSIGHLFASFDLGVCQFAVSGKTTYKSNLASVTQKLNTQIIIPSRLHESDSRIIKYMQRGVDVYIPGVIPIWAKRFGKVTCRWALYSYAAKFSGVDVVIAHKTFYDKSLHYMDFAEQYGCSLSDSNLYKLPSFVADNELPQARFDELTEFLLDFDERGSKYKPIGSSYYVDFYKALNSKHIGEFIRHFLLYLQNHPEDPRTGSFEVPERLSKHSGRDYYAGTSLGA